MLARAGGAGVHRRTGYEAVVSSRDSHCSAVDCSAGLAVGVFFAVVFLDAAFFAALFLAALFLAFAPSSPSGSGRTSVTYGPYRPSLTIGNDYLAIAIGETNLYHLIVFSDSDGIDTILART